MLIGRDSELRALTERIDAATHQGGASVLRGDVGIGKSSLLEAAKAHASGQGFRILATSGIESESHLPFASLHHLLIPVLEEAARLPAAQRDAIRIAFGRSDGDAPDSFALALAVLHLLCEAAERAPVLVVVDDAQWLDRSSADALAFVARRLDSDAIVCLFAIRNGFESVLLKTALPELAVEALADSDAAALLDESAPDLGPELREQVLRDASGNPLALVELPIALRSGAVSAGAPASPWLPVTARLEQAFAARVCKLAGGTRTLLLVAASDEGVGVGDLCRAASEIEGQPVAPDALADAVEAGLVSLDGPRLRFRHPLMRSAIHQMMTPSEKIAAHSAIAAISTDPDRRVWHRAATVIGVDEAIADELEKSAQRAQQRGATAMAVAALERAVQLSGDQARRGGRLVRASELALELGRHSQVLRLLREAERMELEPLDQTRLAWLRETLSEGGSWLVTSRAAASVAIADRMQREGDTDRALDALLMFALRCWRWNPDQSVREQMVNTAERLPVAESDPRLLAILGMASPVERGAVVVDRLTRLPNGVLDTESVHLLGLAAYAVGEVREAERYVEASVARLRAQGRLGLLAKELTRQAWTAVDRGNLRLASVAAAEASRLAEETVQPFLVAIARLAAAIVAAYKGETQEAESIALEAEKFLLPIGADLMLSVVRLVRGASALGDGRPEEAYEHLVRIFDSDVRAQHPLVRSCALIDFVEAALHSGRIEDARSIIIELEALAVRTRSPLLQAGLDVARPVLADDEDAASLFGASPGARLAEWPFARARMELAYGAWLRRQRRVTDSRLPLRAAREAFDALGAVPWGERARQELRASGEVSRQRSHQSADLLSPQEMQIAQMAAQGMTNKEIGSQLFLSHRTIGSHLYRIFPKLAITARSQLRDALETRPAQN